MRRINIAFLFLVTSVISVNAEQKTDIDETIIAQFQPQAEEVSQRLLQELSTELKHQMKHAGVDAAVQVCSTLAPQIVNRISVEKGWRVTRIGTRVRNPLLGTADSWESEALTYFQQQKIAGYPLKAMRFSAVTEETAGRFYRYVRPLALKPECAVCHGDATNVPDSIHKIYPHDLAVGYKAGDLRGAVSIKIPLIE